jgi:hypothetical protein
VNGTPTGTVGRVVFTICHPTSSWGLKEIGIVLRIRAIQLTSWHPS